MVTMAPKQRHLQIEKGRVIAFFDLDWTILTVNSGYAWMSSEFRQGRISRWQFLQAIGYTIGYRLNLIDMHDAHRKALGTVVGQREDELRDRTVEWYLREVVSKVSLDAKRVIEAHRGAGHYLVLLTSASSYEAKVAAEDLRFDAHFGSRYHVESGLFTGELVLPLCYGEGKSIYAERLGRQMNCHLRDAYFYSDSGSDIDLLRKVGYPRAVNPDPRLRGEARRRSWPILNWR